MLMEQVVLWSRWENDGVEHLRIWSDSTGYHADSLVVGLIEGVPMRISYQINCDRQWRVQELFMATLGIAGEKFPRLQVRTDGHGHWQTGSGDALPTLDGCLDVDLRATPFTNTLPIRRLGLQPGKSAEINVVYVDFPTLAVSPSCQRYTNLGIIDGVQHYKFESLEVDFEAKLPVDDDGIVLDYPGLFRRIQSA